ncbi:MAG TPA: Uma2 family endonuclease, partial [Longimicrobiales bacterium]|nr:Uma2 family endonuclease [Longimicrobiales bacterium]
DDPFYVDELVDGWVVREPRPAANHGRLVIRLGGMLDRVVQASGAGYVLTESGFVLQEQPPTVRGPDLSFISRERAPTFPEQGWLRGAPDLAVEILSPSNRPGELDRRIDDYFRAGSRQVWLVDPRARTVDVYHSTTDVTRLAERDVLTGGNVLPDFRVALTELFAL